MKRGLPHDEDAERVLLGNCLLTESASPMLGLHPALFYTTTHQRVAAEILAMADAGEPVTMGRLAQRLDGVVLGSHIAALVDGMPVYDHLSFYRDQIIKLAGYRRGAERAHALQLAYLSSNPEQITEALRSLESVKTQPGSGPAKSPIHSLSLKEFLAMQIRARGMLLSPIIPEQGLVMIYSKRGVGKTHLALGMAVAVASGASFLRWTAPNPQPVLYIDGELPSTLLQKWVAQTVVRIDADAVGDNLRIITPDLQERGIPDLSTHEGQSAIESHVKEARLIILDNLSALSRSGNENEAECWLPLQEWALDLRRANKSVLFIHHAGHQGKNQRGTSKREDLLDTVIALRHPPDYNPAHGLRAEVHMEKARDFHGEEAKPFTVELVVNENGGAQWVTRGLNETQREKAFHLFSDGLGIEDVMQELNVSRAQAFRFQKTWRESQVSHPMARDSETEGLATE